MVRLCEKFVFEIIDRLIDTVALSSFCHLVRYSIRIVIRLLERSPDSMEKFRLWRQKTRENKTGKLAGRKAGEKISATGVKSTRRTA